MSNPKTVMALQKLVALSFLLQNMDDKDLVEDKLSISLAMQEVAKFIGDAHGLDWGALVSGAIEDIGQAMSEGDDAKDAAVTAIRKAMGHKPH